MYFLTFFYWHRLEQVNRHTYICTHTQERTGCNGIFTRATRATRAKSFNHNHCENHITGVIFHHASLHRHSFIFWHRRRQHGRLLLNPPHRWAALIMAKPKTTAAAAPVLADQPELGTYTLRLVAGLKPYEKNARTHSTAQVEQLCRSIKEYGFTNPLLIDDQSRIIAGHGRLQAALALRMTEVPCIMLTGLTEAQRRALILADNKIALNSGWDVKLLTEELADLKIEGYDLTLTGFSLEEINEPKPRRSDGHPTMKPEPTSAIDDLLYSWHRWADQWSPCAGHGSCAMFTGSKTSRQYDSENEVAEASLHNTQMKAIDFHVNEMSEIYRTALQICARNLSTGNDVWRSPRLPVDAETRRGIVTAAKVELMSRMGSA